MIVDDAPNHRGKRVPLGDGDDPAGPGGRAWGTDSSRRRRMCLLLVPQPDPAVLPDRFLVGGEARQ